MMTVWNNGKCGVIFRFSLGIFSLNIWYPCFFMHQFFSHSYFYFFSKDCSLFLWSDLSFSFYHELLVILPCEYWLSVHPPLSLWFVGCLQNVPGTHPPQSLVLLSMPGKLFIRLFNSLTNSFNIIISLLSSVTILFSTLNLLIFSCHHNIFMQY